LALEAAGRSFVRTTAEPPDFFWTIVEIRGGANCKQATEDESKDKRGNDRKQRHGHHVRSSIRMSRPSCRFDARRLAVVPLSSSCPSSCPIDPAGHRSRQGSRQKSEREGQSASERR
jgi:hypothetical protein